MAGSNIRSTNHEKCDPQFIRSFSDRKGLGSSKLSWSKMTPSSMKKENDVLISTEAILENLNRIFQ